MIFDAQRVMEAADLLSGYAGRVAEGSAGQRDAAESMAVAIEQMTAGVNAVADHASQTAANAQAARVVGQGGGGDQRLAGDRAHRRPVADSARVIASLGRAPEAISGIVKVIHEIADQTNLLALRGDRTPGPASRGVASRWWPMKCASLPNAPVGNPGDRRHDLGDPVRDQERHRRHRRGQCAGPRRGRPGLSGSQAAGPDQPGALQTMEKIDDRVAITTHSHEAEQIAATCGRSAEMAGHNSEGARETSPRPPACGIWR